MSTLNPPESPYRGIHPFRYQDRRLFFGREEIASALLAKVLISRLTILFGEQGTGKSSLLNAGLIPGLQKERLQAERLLVQPDGPLIIERVERDNSGSLLPSIFSKDNAKNTSADTRIPCDLKTFADTVRSSPIEARPVFIVDEFEQLFTLFGRDAERSQRDILGVIFQMMHEEALRAKVIIAIREEFLAKLELLAKDYPRILDNRVHLRELDAQCAHDAIRKPFGPPNRFRSQLTEDLADAIVSDLEALGNSPLIHPTNLQIVCSRLWSEHAATRPTIGKSEYEALGRAAGIIGGHLQFELGELDSAARSKVVQCLGGLITESGTRDVVNTEELTGLLVKSGAMDEADLAMTLKFLEERSLVNVTRRRDTLCYEIANECLIPAVQRELRRLGDNAVQDWVKDKAYAISKDRKDRALESLKQFFQRPSAVEELVRDPQWVIALLGSQQESDSGMQDWHDANTCFASEVLAGTFDLVSHLTPASYPRLEAEWLEDVKRLVAYVVWEHELGAIDSVAAYYQACDQIYGNLVRTDKKYSFSDFAPLFLPICRDSTKRRSLTLQKAERLCRLTGTTDSLKNWCQAEDYVKRFYGNIERAVQGDVASLSTVLSTVGPKAAIADHYLVNCLEMAIAIYFLPAEKTQDVLGKPKPSTESRPAVPTPIEFRRQVAAI